MVLTLVSMMYMYATMEDQWFILIKLKQSEEFNFTILKRRLLQFLQMLLILIMNINVHLHPNILTQTTQSNVHF